MSARGCVADQHERDLISYLIERTRKAKKRKEKKSKETALPRQRGHEITENTRKTKVIYL